MGDQAQLEVDPLERELFNSAATGDAVALALLAHVARQPSSYEPPVPLIEALAAAEAFARLAVVHENPFDKMVLADILAERSMVTSDPIHGKRLIAEAAEWQNAALDAGNADLAPHLPKALSAHADMGDEWAAFELNRLMAKHAAAQRGSGNTAN